MLSVPFSVELNDVGLLTAWSGAAAQCLVGTMLWFR